MTVALLYHILIVFAFLGWIGGTWGGPRFGWFAPYNNGLLLILIFLVGLGVYGWPIRG